MKNLNDATDAELQAELERRKVLTNQPPQPLANPDFSALQQTVIECVLRTHQEQYEDEDSRYYISQEAITAIYGPAYREWRVKQKF